MSAENLKIGACDAWFKGSYLGRTKGGATVSIAPENIKLTADQWGETPVDFALNGETVTVTIRIAEVDLDVWEAGLPHGTRDGASDGRLTLGSNAGKRLASKAGQLVLRPIGNTDGSEDVVLNKAVAMDEIEVDFNNEDQRVLEIPFVALVDTTKSDGNWLGHIGDSTD